MPAKICQYDGAMSSASRKAVAWLNSLGCPHALLVNDIGELADVVVLEEVVHHLLWHGDRVSETDTDREHDRGSASSPGKRTRAVVRLLETIALHCDYTPTGGSYVQAAMKIRQMKEVALLELVEALQNLSITSGRHTAASTHACLDFSSGDRVRSTALHYPAAPYREDRQATTPVEESATRTLIDTVTDNERAGVRELRAGSVLRLAREFEKVLRVPKPTSPPKWTPTRIGPGSTEGQEGSTSDELRPPSATSIRALSMLASESTDGESIDGDEAASEQSAVSKLINAGKPTRTGRRASIPIPTTSSTQASAGKVALSRSRRSSLTASVQPHANATTIEKHRVELLSEEQERIVIWLLEFGLPLPGARVQRKSHVSVLPTASRVAQSMRSGALIARLVMQLESPTRVSSATKRAAKGAPLLRVVDNPKSMAECRANLRNALSCLHRSVSFSGRDGRQDHLSEGNIRDIVDGKEERIWALLRDLYDAYGARTGRPLKLSFSERGVGARDATERSGRHSLSDDPRALCDKDTAPGEPCDGDLREPNGGRRCGDHDAWVAKMNTAKRAARKRHERGRVGVPKSTETQIPPIDCLNIS